MVGPGRRYLVALGFACGASPGCNDEHLRPPIVWEGEHLRFGTNEDLTEVCAGTLPYADAIVGYLAETLDRPAAAVDYYWVPDGSACESDALGCAEGSAVFGKVPFLQHELVHAVGGPFSVHLDEGVEEGVAEAFGDDYPWNTPISGDLAVLLESHANGRKLVHAEYPLAGHFASFLRVDGGNEALAELWQTLRRGSDWEHTQKVFAEIYARPLEAAVTEYEATYPICSRTYYRDNGFDCGTTALQLPDSERLGADPTRLAIDLQCDATDVLGPRLGERWRTVTLELSGDTAYRMGLEKVGGVSPGDVRIRECGQSCFDVDEPRSFFIGDYVADAHDEASDPGGLYGDIGCVRQGKYTVRVAIEDEDEGSIVLWLEAVGIC